MKIGTKIVCFTDVHFGLRNNEDRHNQECVDFIKWMVTEAEEFGAKISVCLGDWHHSRSSINVKTLQYSNQAFDILNKFFDKHYQIIGNHDLFYKNNRGVHSVEFVNNSKNIEIINEITTIGDVILAPWLIDDEYKKLVKKTQPYIFGHFEFPHFLMNAQVAMPDIGHINANQFKASNQNIFSGHFHKRQMQTNIHGSNIIYMGNCFPHNFSDAGDDDRGIMLLEIGKDPIFKKWPGAPKYRILNLSDLIENPEKHIDNKTIAKVTIDLDISFEESNFIRETMIQQFKVREFRLIPNKSQFTVTETTEGMTFDSVDQIVINQLNSIDSQTMDKELLIQLYNNI